MNHRVLRNRGGVVLRLSMALATLFFSFDSQAQTVSICSRTSQIQAAILAELVGTDNCSAVTSTQLAGIRTLDASNESISSLQAGDFSGLTSLEDLLLDSNSLTNLPENLFDGLISLENLRLDDNSLTSLPEDLFDGLTSLEDLWLDDNSLTSLPEDLSTDSPA